jgi:sterol desaturase/sphingolipid hydroxylase (fatty acid hydroxylase superfamily)
VAGPLETLLAFLILGAVFIPLERLFAARPQRVLRREWGLDLLFFAGQYLLWTGLVTLALVWISLRCDELVPGTAREWVRSLPWLLQALLVVLLGDLLVYWGHRLSHRSEFLWRFHRVHHTAPQLDWLAAHREHPLDGLYTQVLANLPAIVLGFPLATIAGVAAFRGMWGLVIHANVQLPLGPLKYVLGAPRLHHWHHDVEQGGRCNFANLMPLWDVAFGTYREPATEPPAVGDATVGAESYLGHLLGPLGVRVPRLRPAAGSLPDAAWNGARASRSRSS